MAKGYVLYNPLAGKKNAEKEVRLLKEELHVEPEYYDMTRITNYAAFLGDLGPEDVLVIAGGDGTLNRFVNETCDIPIACRILYYPIGSGNDFARDVADGSQSKLLPVTEYLRDLPRVTVNGKEYRFINGIGFGIDGYCCQEGEEQRKDTAKKIDYTAIAIKGLLFGFSSRKARVVVDGKEYHYKNVWIAPTMYGLYYGGGMMPAPEQSRRKEEKALSLTVFRGASRLLTLMMFPGIFKGTHIKHRRHVAVHTGRSITVEFDRPTPLQIDGETIRDVLTYRAEI